MPPSARLAFEVGTVRASEALRWRGAAERKRPRDGLGPATPSPPTRAAKNRRRHDPEAVAAAEAKKQQEGAARGC